MLIHTHAQGNSITHSPKHTQDKESITHSSIYVKTITHPHSHTRGRVLLIHLNSHTKEEYYSFIQTHIQDKGSVLLTHPQGNRITHSPKLTYKIWEEHYSLTHTNTQYEGVLLTHPHKGRVLLAHPHSHNIKEEYYSST